MKVDLWLIAVNGNLAAARSRIHVLDVAERGRLDSMRNVVAASSYLVAHVALRVLLGRRLAMVPEDVLFGCDPCLTCGGPHGKPTLPDDTLHFSLSHTGNLILVGVGEDALGVDIEQLRPARDRRRVISRLHPGEQEVLNAAHDDIEILFVDCWARKEAYLKANGMGLAAGLDSVYTGFSVDVAPAATVALLPDSWRCAPIDVPAGYRAAMVSRALGDAPIPQVLILS